MNLPILLALSLLSLVVCQNLEDLISKAQPETAVHGQKGRGFERSNEMSDSWMNHVRAWMQDQHFAGNNPVAERDELSRSRKHSRQGKYNHRGHHPTPDNWDGEYEDSSTVPGVEHRPHEKGGDSNPQEVPEGEQGMRSWRHHHMRHRRHCFLRILEHIFALIGLMVVGRRFADKCRRDREPVHAAARQRAHTVVQGVILPTAPTNVV